jgi:hypothetical protein
MSGRRGIQFRILNARSAIPNPQFRIPNFQFYIPIPDSPRRWIFGAYMLYVCALRRSMTAPV